MLGHAKGHVKTILRTSSRPVWNMGLIRDMSGHQYDSPNDYQVTLDLNPKATRKMTHEMNCKVTCTSKVTNNITFVPTGNC